MSARQAQDRIGRYRVVRILGAGGFATVLEAVDDRLDDRVAIKVLAENHSLDPEVRARFLAEGRVLRRVDSAHVVRVLDLGETDRQQPYLVLELADRGTLEDRVATLRGGGWVPGADDVVALVRPLVDALGAVHRADIVHRDLSPGNVLLRSTLAPDAAAATTRLIGDDERLVLADLGLSKDLARSSGLTVSGGTEGFRPPEQRGGPAAVDVRADLWSLSALVVWLVAGDRPADQQHARALLRGTSLPDGVVEPVVRSLAALPGGRHPDVGSWHRDLERGLRRPPVPAPPPAPSTPHASVPDMPGSGGRAPASRRRIGRGLLAAALVLGLVLGGVVVAALPSAPRQQVEIVDGTATVTTADDDLVVTITGPQTVEVGASAVFHAGVAGASDWAWVGPDGRIHPNVERLEVRASGAGETMVTLLGTGANGREVRAVHRLRVVSP